MMLKVAKLGIAIAAISAWIVPAAYAGVPDVTQSFYVPQSGTTGAPAEGTLATRFFRACPNNDGGASLPNSARVKVVVKDVNGNGISGISAADICVMFNGGTGLGIGQQGFSGVGADSVIANSQFNPGAVSPPAPLCPDVRCIQADDQTDVNGATFITFTGATVGSPGVGTRNANRKWGHYDTAIPVYVLGFQLSGRLTTGSANGTYTLRIKNFDWTGGLGTTQNLGETVTGADFNGVAAGINVNNVISYWKDFDSSGSVTATDFNLISVHTTHDCDTPNNP
jgi:hypothetical protein